MNSNQKIGSSVRGWRVFLCAVFFVLTFRTLQFVPQVGGYLREAWIVVVVASILFLFFTRKLRKLGKYFRPFLLFCGCVSLLTIYVAVRANAVFGQPIETGILAARGFLLAFSAILLLYLVRINYFLLSEVERALVALGWTALVCYTVLTVAFDPQQFADVAGFGYGGEASGRYGFVYDTAFITFGFVFYAIKTFSKRNILYPMYALTHMGFIVLVSQRRAITLALLITLFFFIWYRFKTGALLLALQVGSILVTIVILIATTSGFFDISALSDKFSDAFTVVTTGEKTDDFSANSRILQIELAKTHVSENPFLGNGVISKRWEWGYWTAVGGRFFPADIGIFGSLWVFGLLGLIFLMIQFYFALRWYVVGKSLPRFRDFSDCLIAVVLFNLLVAIFNGNVFLNPEENMLYISLLGLIAFLRVSATR